MKKTLTKYLNIVTFKVGLDVLGFPKYHEHHLTFSQSERIYVTKYHEKYHKSKKH